VSHHHRHHSKQPSQRERVRPGPHLESRVRGSNSEIASYLSALADALRGGGVQIRAGDHAVGLLLDELVTLDLRAEAGDGHTSQISLVISWQAPPVAPPAPKLRITTLPPAGQLGHPRPVAPTEVETATPDAGSPSVAPSDGMDHSKRGQPRLQEC
jgi:amphi-Trp domain-containing protein